MSYPVDMTVMCANKHRSAYWCTQVRTKGRGTRHFRVAKKDNLWEAYLVDADGAPILAPDHLWGKSWMDQDTPHGVMRVNADGRQILTISRNMQDVVWQLTDLPPVNNPADRFHHREALVDLCEWHLERGVPPPGFAKDMYPVVLGDYRHRRRYST
jgi:hypothetical protein